VVELTLKRKHKALSHELAEDQIAFRRTEKKKTLRTAKETYTQTQNKSEGGNGQKRKTTFWQKKT